MHNLPVNFTCGLNQTCNVSHESCIAVIFLSSLSYLIIFLLLILYQRGDDNIFSLGYPTNLIALFFAVLLSAITELSVPVEFYDIYACYTMALLIVIIIVTVLGPCVFFQAPEVNSRIKFLGFFHANMSLIIWVVTIPLVLMELFVCIAVLKNHKNPYLAGVKSIGLLQKLIQAGVYHFNLRFKVVCRDKKQGASWYLKILSCFNFGMWLDSIVTAKDGNEYIEELFGKGFSIITATCNALLIDYRLFCCLLFAEHAFDIDNGETDESEVEVDEDSRLRNPSFRVNTSQMSGFGYVFGFVMIALQLICGLQYADFVGSWTNVFPIIADVVVIVLGLILLKLSGNVKDESIGIWRETNSKGVDVMVAIMGVTGFIFWFIKTLLNAVWVHNISNLSPDQTSYLKFSCAKNLVRFIGILFQLYLFIKADPFIGCRENIRTKRVSYFILPALMLSLLSVFVMSVIDSYSGIVEGLIANSGISETLMILLKAGEPIHLGFTLHVFLHFYIINDNMTTKKVLVRRRGGGSSRPESRMAVSSQVHNTERQPLLSPVAKE